MSKQHVALAIVAILAAYTYWAQRDTIAIQRETIGLQTRVTAALEERIETLGATVSTYRELALVTKANQRMCRQSLETCAHALKVLR